MLNWEKREDGTAECGECIRHIALNPRSTIREHEQAAYASVWLLSSAGSFVNGSVDVVERLELLFPIALLAF
jgi:hypothetical protein